MSLPNVLQLQDKLKNFSQDQLVQEMELPSGSVPQFLVLGEIDRRARMERDFTAAQGLDDTTVAEDAVAAAGIPSVMSQEMSGTMNPENAFGESGEAMPMPLEQGMLPPEPMAEMAGGGYIPMASGGRLAPRVYMGRLIYPDDPRYEEADFIPGDPELVQPMQTNPLVMAEPPSRSTSQPWEDLDLIDHATKDRFNFQPNDVPMPSKPAMASPPVIDVRLPRSSARRAPAPIDPAVVEASRAGDVVDMGIPDVWGSHWEQNPEEAEATVKALMGAQGPGLGAVWGAITDQTYVPGPDGRPVLKRPMRDRLGDLFNSGKEVGPPPDLTFGDDVPAMMPGTVGDMANPDGTAPGLIEFLSEPPPSGSGQPTPDGNATRDTGDASGTGGAGSAPASGVASSTATTAAIAKGQTPQPVSERDRYKWLAMARFGLELMDPSKSIGEAGVSGLDAYITSMQYLDDKEMALAAMAAKASGRGGRGGSGKGKTKDNFGISTDQKRGIDAAKSYYDLASAERALAGEFEEGTPEWQQHIDRASYYGSQARQLETVSAPPTPILITPPEEILEEE